tara:strand:+ start:387 stop:548 length:162 start_codon:yes stop_codon:yes gene_type:complete
MYEVRCYDWIEGVKTLVAWSSNINKTMAVKFCNEYHREGHALIEMKNLEKVKS